MSQSVAIVAVLALSACAGAPNRINDVCAVFAQNDGWIGNWRSAAYAAERKHGIPMHILMATVRKESGFKSNARPPRKYYLGFIPGKRASSAYGYSQALDGTWAQYMAETRNFGARRSSFADAVDFVGWYHGKTVAKHGVSSNDAFGLYLAYYSGWSGYANGSWRSNSSLQGYAKATAEMASRYQAQLAGCK